MGVTVHVTLLGRLPKLSPTSHLPSSLSYKMPLAARKLRVCVHYGAPGPTTVHCYYHANSTINKLEACCLVLIQRRKEALLVLHRKIPYNGARRGHCKSGTVLQ